jgi:hypothetical protein
MRRYYEMHQSHIARSKRGNFTPLSLDKFVTMCIGIEADEVALLLCK